MQLYYMQHNDGSVFETANPQYHGDCKQLSQSEGKRLHRAQTVEKVKCMLAGIDTVYGIVRHVSASGMSRNIDLYIIKDNRPVYLTGYASIILGYRLTKDRGMVVGGCGMDMIYHCVSTLCDACGIDYRCIRSEVL